jgi:hypothetical protein
MDALEMHKETVEVKQIPPLEHEEAGQLAREELSRFLTVVEDLSGDDWQ